MAQGLDGVVEGTDTIDFIAKSEIPPDHWNGVTYTIIVCNYWPEKLTQIESKLPSAATESTAQTIVALPPLISSP